MDADDRELFEQSLRRAVESHSGPALDIALDELGWHEALCVDTQTAVSSLFELQGATNANTAAVGAVLGTGLGLGTSFTGGFVLPSLGEWRAPGEVVQGDLAVRGLGTASLPHRATTLVVARHDEIDLVLEVTTSDLTLRPRYGLDPSLGLVDIAGDRVPFTTHGELATAQWPNAVALARLAVSHDLLGGARTMLQLACQHALDRIQFGHPISSFQAVRHRLADTLVAIEAAEGALGSAWEVGSPPAAAMAKALAGRSARTAARHCQQVLGGIGFTTEHHLHRYVRRTLVLDELFGSARTLTRDLGDELLTTRSLPPLPPL